MQKYPRPTKQFDFIGKGFAKLAQTQRSLVRRTDYRGVPFNNGVGAQSREVQEAIMNDMDPVEAQRSAFIETQEVELNWSEADGYEITGPTFLTLKQKGQDLLEFRVDGQFTFMWYSNERYFIDTPGIIERL